MEDPNRCQLPDESFSHSNILRNLLQKHEYLCDKCGHKCVTQYSLEEHFKWHEKESANTLSAHEEEFQKNIKKEPGSDKSSLLHSKWPEIENAFTLSAHEEAFQKNVNKEPGADKSILVHNKWKEKESAFTLSADEEAFQKKMNEEPGADISSLVHSKWQEKESPFPPTNGKFNTCGVCGKTFNNEDSYRKHLKRHELKETRAGKTACKKEKSHVCDVCCKAFINKRTLKAHAKYHTGEKSHVCEVCYRQFTTMGTLKRHALYHTGEKPHQCIVCQKAYVAKASLNAHLCNHTEAELRKYYEEISEKIILAKKHKFENSLKNPLVDHTGKKPYACEICHKKFAGVSFLKRHALCHAGDKPHRCAVCRKVYFDKQGLHAHLRNHTEADLHKYYKEISEKVLKARRYVCDICGKAYNHLPCLKNHVFEHTKGKPYVYKMCNEKFSFKNTLKDHIISHTGGKLYQCAVCLKTFFRKLKFLLHLHFHKKGELRRYYKEGSEKILLVKKEAVTCEVCGKDFTTKTSLYFHKRSHPKVQALECGKCGKKFKLKKPFEQHCLTHFNNRKSHKCNICGKKHIQQSPSLKTHILLLKLHRQSVV